MWAAMVPIGEMWSVVNMSPKMPSTRAPLMSLFASGCRVIPAKYGGRRMKWLSARQSKSCPPEADSARHCGVPSRMVA